jgi:hypothetical protein
MSRSEAQHFLAATKAGKLLLDYAIERPDQIQLEDIAWDLGMDIAYKPLSGCEANLIRIGKSGTITVNQRLEGKPSARFAIGHEIGHWAMHQEYSQFFLCTTEDLREYRNSGMEQEANTFSCDLLMPRFMMPKELWIGDPSLTQVQIIAEQFGVSLTSAAVRWADVSKHALLSVFSDGKNVTWWRRNDGKCNGLWCTSRQQVPVDSVTAHLAANTGITQFTKELPADAWFGHVEWLRAKTLVESSMRLGRTGSMLTLLWLPEMG